MKRIVSLLLAMTMMVAAIAGCSKKEDPDLGATTQKPASTPAPQSDNNEPEPEAEDEGPQYDYARVTWYFNVSGIQCPPDAYQCRMAIDEINVEYVPINPTSSEYENILLNLIASGDAPDVMGTWADFQMQLLRDDLIIPVEDYLNADYLPNLIRISSAWEPVLDTLRFSDGHIYAVPSVKNNLLPEQYDWIRQDWLDKVGMSAPTTFEELAEVLIAFAQGNPNGDNVNYYANMFNELWGVGWIFDAYGARQDRWYIAEDGLPELGILSPRIKEALEYVKYLYDNKAMNEDFMTTKYDLIGEKIKAGVVGYHHGWSGYDHWDGVDGMINIYPDSKWVPIMPIKSPYYDKGYADYVRITDYTSNQYSISSSCKDVDAVMRLMDWMCVDTSTSTDPKEVTFEGSYWYAMGEVGVNYEIFNQKYCGGGNFPDNQELSDKYKAQNEVDKWAGWPMRRFQSIYDPRWRGNNDRDIELTAWKETVPSGKDIPADNPYLARAWSVPLDDEDYSKFMAVFNDLDTMGKFAEIIGYPAILSKGDIDTLYDEWLNYANANGYQEVRQIVADHMAANPFNY